MGRSTTARGTAYMGNPNASNPLAQYLWDISRAKASRAEEIVWAIRQLESITPVEYNQLVYLCLILQSGPVIEAAVFCLPKIQDRAYSTTIKEIACRLHRLVGESPGGTQMIQKVMPLVAERSVVGWEILSELFEAGVNNPEKLLSEVFALLPRIARDEYRTSLAWKMMIGLASSMRLQQNYNPLGIARALQIVPRALLDSRFRYLLSLSSRQDVGDFINWVNRNNDFWCSLATEIRQQVVGYIARATRWWSVDREDEMVFPLLLFLARSGPVFGDNQFTLSSPIGQAVKAIVPDDRAFFRLLDKEKRNGRLLSRSDAVLVAKLVYPIVGESVVPAVEELLVKSEKGFVRSTLLKQ